MSLGTQEQYDAAPWMKIAESYLGTKEIRGGENKVILRFFAEAGHSEIKEDEVAWCSAFANAVLFEAGLHGTQNLMAKSFLNWAGGTKVTEPQFGDVAIFTRGKPSQGLGHVTFFLDWDEDTVTCLGGNQGAVGEVNVEKISRGALVGFRRPIYKPVPKPATPAITDKEQPDQKPQATGALGGIGAVLATIWGDYQTALIIAAFTVLVIFAYWYWSKMKSEKDAAAMTPQYRPSSRTAAAQKIAEYVPPVEPTQLTVQQLPKKKSPGRKRKSST